MLWLQRVQTQTVLVADTGEEGDGERPFEMLKIFYFDNINNILIFIHHIIW